MKIASTKDQMQVRPTFAVLMSVYKGENATFLEQALQSIADQTVQPDQIVIVKDGPLTAELDDVLDRWQSIWNDRCQLIALSSNHGLGGALYEGTKLVKTEWVARMDSDDIAVKDRFAIQLFAIQRHPELAVLGGQIDEFNRQVDQPIGQRKVPLTSTEIRQFMKYRNPFNHPTVMIKKTVLDRVGGYRSNGKLEDYFLWARIISQGEQTLNVPQVLVHMRVGAGMYDRRGDLKDLKHVFMLRLFMKKNRLISWRELILSCSTQLINILVPTIIRKFVYRKLLHKK